MTTLTIIATILLIVIGLVVIAELAVMTVLLLRVNKITQQVRNHIDPVINESTRLLHTANDVAADVKPNVVKVSDSVRGITQQVQSRVGPIMDESTRMMHTANDVAADMKPNIVQMSDTVKGITQQVKSRVGPIMDASTRLLHTANDVADTVKTNTAQVGDTVQGVTRNIANRVDQTAANMQRVTGKTVEQLSRPPVLAGLTLLAGVGAAALFRRVVSWPVLAMASVLTMIPAGLRAWQLYQQRLATQAPAEGRAPLILNPTEDTEMRRRAA
ncbi:MAG: hypothetical protein ACYC6A_11890 [Armatimonadota bacterium]